MFLGHKIFKNIYFSIFAIFYLSQIIIGCGERVQYDFTNSKIGKTIIFKTSMYYAENFKYKIVDKETYKYRCHLVREQEINSLSDTFFEGKKKLIPVKNGMHFTVKGIYNVIPIGISAAFGDGYQMVAVDDENGKACTYLVSSIRNNEWIN